MMLPMTRRTVAGLALLPALLLPSRIEGARQVAASNAVLTTRHFAFYSDFDVNLNDAFVVDFIATRDGRPGLFATGAEKTCFDALPEADRAGWARATEYYRANRATPAQLLLLRLELGGLVQRELLPEGASRQVLEAFATARRDGAAAYRQCRWPSQDATNRAWTAGLQPLLAAHETALGEELPRVFRTSWNFLPFRVDVMRRGNPNGGNMSSDIDGRPHIVVSSEHPGNQGLARLEVVFHEAAHFLAAPGKPFGDAIAAAAKAQGAAAPFDILHQAHFFVVGETVRRRLERAGQSYTPFVYAQKLFSDRYREVATRIWMPVIDGARPIDQAATEFVASVGK
jgi:hypothetical protein